MVQLPISPRSNQEQRGYNKNSFMVVNDHSENANLSNKALSPRETMQTKKNVQFSQTLKKHIQSTNQTNFDQNMDLMRNSYQGSLQDIQTPKHTQYSNNHKNNSSYIQGPKKIQIHKLEIAHIESRELSDDEPDVPDPADSLADFSDSVSAIKINSNKKESKVPKEKSMVNIPNQAANKQLLRQRSANKYKIQRNRRSVVSHEVSSGNESDEEMRFDQQANIISQVQNNIIQKKDFGKMKQKLKDRNIKGKPAQKDKVATPSVDETGVTVQTPVNNKVHTPKPQPKPFNPPRQSFVKLNKMSQVRDLDTSTPNLKRGRAELNNLQNIILGDSDFSEEPIGDEDQDLSESSSMSSHSNNTQVGQVFRPNHRFSRIRNSLKGQKIKAFGRKSTIDAEKTMQMWRENYDQVQLDEPTSGINEIHVSGSNSRQKQGSLNFRNKIDSFNSNFQTIDDYQTQKNLIQRRKLGKTSSHATLNIQNILVQKKHLKSENIHSPDNAANDTTRIQDESYFPRNEIGIGHFQIFKPGGNIVNRNINNQLQQRKNSCNSDNRLADLRYNAQPTNDSGDPNQETIEINSAATFNNKFSGVQINRGIFEISLKLKNLTEIPEAKIKNNHQLKILDLSHNKIANLPFDLFWYIPNIVKVVLDYNELQRIHIGVGDVQKAHNNQSFLMNQGKIDGQLSKLQVFSVANNKLNMFPVDCFVKTDAQNGNIVPRQQNLQLIQMNDNNIQQIQNEFGYIRQVRSLLLHSNPINRLPKSLNSIWREIQEFSIDWLVYLTPQVGKILRCNTTQTGDSDGVSEGVFDKRKESTQSAVSKVKGGLVPNRGNQSFIKGINNQNKKTCQNDRIRQIMAKFGRMLDWYASSQVERDKSFVRFTDFMCFFMRKHPNQTQDQIIKSMAHFQKERTILHQLTEDNQLNLVKDILNHNQSQPRSAENIKFVNLVDGENSTALVIALKSKFIELSSFYLQTYGDKLDILIRSKKLGNAINLAIKCQDFTIIDAILNHQQIKSQDSHILNYIIPNFEKNPTENAKFMVKLILEKGMDPNYLREKFLKKDYMNQKDKTKELLPEKILEVSPISLACMKYQNIALNFLIKFNNTIREIIKLKQRVKRQHMISGKNFSPTPKDKNDPYRQLISQLDSGKQARVMKFFTYIEDISNSKGISKEEIIDENLKLFDFNLKSGPNYMHPLHFAVQANNVKAIEKLKRIQAIENIDFYARDGVNLDFPQEFAAPSAPIYKIVMRAQKNLISRKYMEIRQDQTGFPYLNKPQVNQFNQNTSKIKQNQLSIGQSYLEQMVQLPTYIDHEMVQHTSLNLRKNAYERPKYIMQSDQLVFTQGPRGSAKTTSFDSKHYFDNVIQKNIELVRNMNHNGRSRERLSNQTTQNIQRPPTRGSANSMQYKPYQIQQKTQQPLGRKTIQNESNISLATIQYNYNERNSFNNNHQTLIPNHRENDIYNSYTPLQVMQKQSNVSNASKQTRRQSQQHRATKKNIPNNSSLGTTPINFQQLIQTKKQEGLPRQIQYAKHVAGNNKKVSQQKLKELDETEIENFQNQGEMMAPYNEDFTTSGEHLQIAQPQALHVDDFDLTQEQIAKNVSLRQRHQLQPLDTMHNFFDSMASGEQAKYPQTTKNQNISSPFENNLGIKNKILPPQSKGQAVNYGKVK